MATLKENFQEVEESKGELFEGSKKLLIFNGIERVPVNSQSRRQACSVADMVSEAMSADTLNAELDEAVRAVSDLPVTNFSDLSLRCNSLLGQDSAVDVKLQTLKTSSRSSVSESSEQLELPLTSGEPKNLGYKDTRIGYRAILEGFVPPDSLKSCPDSEL